MAKLSRLALLLQRTRHKRRFRKMTQRFRGTNQLFLSLFTRVRNLSSCQGRVLHRWWEGGIFVTGYPLSSNCTHPLWAPGCSWNHGTKANPSYFFQSYAHLFWNLVKTQLLREALWDMFPSQSFLYLCLICAFVSGCHRQLGFLLGLLVWIVCRWLGRLDA